MAQHFLLSKAAKTLSLASVARMSDQEARVAFERVRWSDNGGNAYCPRCGCVKVYTLGTRPGWKCSGCKYQFSVTSGTIFADRKRPVRDYLLAIAIFANGAKGHSALQLSRDLNCQYKTAFVLAHKLRDAIAAASADLTIGGAGKVGEIDGAYFGGHSRKENRADERKDRRLVEEQTGKRQVVVVMRERGGRTLPVVVAKESHGVPVILQRVKTDTILHADEASGWDRLHAHYEMFRINHSVAYSLDGACTNQAESYFARLRRAENGIHHRVSGRLLGSYASEMAWREDNRRVPNGTQANMIAAAAMRRPTGGEWCGYWQRNQHG